MNGRDRGGWNDNFQPPLFFLIYALRIVFRNETSPFGVEVVEQVQQVFQVAAEPIKLTHHQSVAAPQPVKEFLKLGAVSTTTAKILLVAALGKGAALGDGVLLLADAGRADELGVLLLHRGIAVDGSYALCLCKPEIPC
ncbi:hypothetical protein ACVWZX_005206 [Deinococcus sp. UYEF24]